MLSVMDVAVNQGWPGGGSPAWGVFDNVISMIFICFIRVVFFKCFPEAVARRFTAFKHFHDLVKVC